MNSLGTLWVFAIMLIICADVISNNVFGFPLRGVAEVVGYSLAGAVFLQLAHTLHVGRFVRAEMFIEPLERNHPAIAAIFQIAFSLAGAIVFGLIVYGTYFKFLEAWPDLTFGVEGEFTILVWPLRLIILFGSATIAIKYLINVRDAAATAMAHRTSRRAGQAGNPFAWGYLLVIVAIIALIAATGIAGFEKTTIGALSFVGMLLLIFSGMHIAIALIILGFAGIWMMMGNETVALNTVKLASNEFLREYFFGVVPLFVLMGLLVNESDVGRDTFNVARWAFRSIKGGLGIATIAANALFAAITGSSIASAAVFTKIAAPHMMNHGYTAKFAVGTVAGSSVLGMLIPPSLLLIVYGFVAEQSVGILFMAAIVPGLILATAMAIAVFAMAHYWPAFVGNPAVDDLANENVTSASLKLLPILSLIVVVLGGMYAGFYTPVEAGAVGAAGALIIGLIKRRLTWEKLWKVLVETGHVTVAILFLILAANIYGRMLALSGFPQSLGAMIGSADLGFYAFMALYVLMVLLLGMFLESISLMLIVLPLTLPIVTSFGADLIWFGIVTVITVEMGLLTPPLGISVYVVRSTINDPRVTLNQVFIGAAPYVAIMFIVTVLLILFPKLTLVFV